MCIVLPHSSLNKHTLMHLIKSMHLISYKCAIMVAMFQMLQLFSVKVARSDWPSVWLHNALALH